ncbi:MAG: M3 family oligoendopeptidase [Chloroflexi bacterium]|nr:M3 family oligoendopeptidase [Chloroflexota bacterium]
MDQQTPTMTGAEEVSWDLTDLYSAQDDPAIDADLHSAQTTAQALAADYRGRIATLSAGALASMLQRYEQAAEKIARAYSYASMAFSVDTADPALGALVAKMQENYSQFQQTIIFFSLEWANLDPEQAQALIEDPALSRYRHYLETLRMREPYMLSEPEEKILAEKAVTGRSAWVRYFTQVQSAARYPFRGEPLSQSAILAKLYEADRDMRIDAWQGITDGLRANAMTNTYIFNQVLADKASNDRLRGYPSWITSRNLSNEVDDESVQALIDAVTSRYDIVQRYYTLKRNLMGLDELFDYDRYAPLEESDAFFSWDEARTMVLESFGAFHPTVQEVANHFFEGGWIDAPNRPAKRGGAYATPTVPSVHPYVFMNYMGRARDVETLAHELGHGIHMYLSRQQGILQAGTPLTTAETASTFAEMLVFQDLLERAQDPRERLALLSGKIEGSFATVFRQISMNRFEESIHLARRGEGELSTARFSELWLASQRAMFGDSVTMTGEYGLWWSYVPHFLHTPGYVYAYAFGELLVLALYARYQQGAEGFEERYIEALSMGGADWPHTIMAPLGVDLTDPQFWHEGLGILDDLVGEAEAIAAETI